MQEGALTVKTTQMSPSQNDPFVNAVMMRGADFVSSMAMSGQGGSTIVEGPLWQEYTGKEGGWLSRKKKVRFFSVHGRRCTACGYIELYANQAQEQD